MSELDHKYFELLRHHVTSEIRDSTAVICASSDGVPGYAVGVMFDMAIAVLFSETWASGEAPLGHRVAFVLALLLAYVLVSFAWDAARRQLEARRRAAGVDDASDRGIARLVDLFDNDISDALLISEHYYGLYGADAEATGSHLPKIYLFESLHYLEKAANNFDRVYALRLACLDDDGLHSGKVARYRAKTFAEEAKALGCRLEQAFSGVSGDKPSNTELENLRAQMASWKF